MPIGSLYQDPDEFMKNLTQAISGANPAAQPEQPAAAPQGSLEQLQALMAQQQDASAQQQEAQARATAASLATPRSGFRKEGGTWGQAFKDPSKAQANAMVAAGLALATSDPTKNLSQRIGMALGSGVNALTQTRDTEQKRVAAGAQAEADRFKAEGESLGTQFNQQKDMLGISGDAAQREIENKRNRVIDAANVIKNRKAEAIAAAKEKRESTAFAQKQNQREFTDFKTIDPNSNQPMNVYKGAGGGYFVVDPNEEGGFRTLTTAELSNMYEPKSPGLSIGADGQLVVNPSVDKEIIKTDQKLIREHNTKLDESQDSIAALAEMSVLLDAGARTGGLSIISQTLGKGIRSVEEEAGIEVPFFEDAQNQYRMLDTFDTLSRQLGVEGLRLFGGSDTERELLVSLSIQPNSNYAPEINRAIIKRKQLAYDILSTKGDVMNRWIEENGSLQARNKEGNGFNKEWHDYQKQAYNLKNDAMIEKLKDYKGYGAFKNDLGTAKIKAASYEQQALRKKRLDKQTKDAFSIINSN